jgi:hypothetical protein
MKEGPMDPLLRKALGAADVPVTPACVDAERLAAWSEGALPADDASAVELHLSTCGRCQAMAAVFSQIAPDAPVTVPFWRRRFVGWLIPLAAVATAAMLWIARPRVTDLPAPTHTAQVQPQNTPAALPPPAIPDRRPEVTAEAKVTPPPSSPAAAASNARATSPASAAVPAPPPPPPPQPPQPKLFVAPPTSNAAPPAVATAAPIPPPAPTPPPPPPVTATADATRPAGAAFRSAVAANEAATGIIEIVAPSLATAQSVVSAAGGAGGRGGGGGRGAAAPSPVRWRILPTNAVERSTTGGASWQPIVIDPPATLTGGVAASSTVCWLIGRGGVVLRSVDGIHFDRVTFPEAIDLVSIRSTGAAQASVTTADGRVFVTIDGGLTWRLQGFQTSSF